MLPVKLNVLQSVDEQIKSVFNPHIVGDVNDSQVKVAKFGEVFDWHSHPDEDEGFFVLRGRIAIDFRDGTVEMGEGDYLTVPRAVEHRPRSLSKEPVVIMIEPATTLNTGDAASDLTVSELQYLKPVEGLEQCLKAIDLKLNDGETRVYSTVGRGCHPHK